MYSGQCLCGVVQFEIKGPIHHIVHCHCSECRKAQGSAYATNGIVQSTDFKILCGKDKLTAYESSPGQKKYFCKICGSPIISKRKLKPEQLRIRLGTVTSNVMEQPEAHIFVSSKADWDIIHDDLPQYEAYEPGR
ncbi:MAG: GFA family protein [gamma proteobacterium symbiont of Bathyaustriella thionipta]|nr:GFA family protein [gamma proteobacterium symbiont of Bathyaustriella thionipta]MCU7951123.1 GFA family protein [gamma proteobacterium symbiont of Bathyaustriella thionipta]MCU7954552.1 GFA family protein [gamma proteobacterium symbiont of Bathyaustriella thionipta]MCU7957638.1 GFA family protein [gamma proteobacterium symbiont of Bathyaustriella thionipta]MCU7966909.1 GFA family protein [gamma proteobacterium symbiont of Bathyaustriella thionipta]